MNTAAIFAIILGLLKILKPGVFRWYSSEEILNRFWEKKKKTILELDYLIELVVRFL